MSKAAVFMTSGTEEVEALMVVDMLRRAKIDTTIVAITEDKSITGSHNITVLADNTFEEVDYALEVIGQVLPMLRRYSRH